CATGLEVRTAHHPGPFPAGEGLHTKSRHSGAPRSGEPGTHKHRPLEYGFRARRCAAPRNDPLRGCQLAYYVYLLASGKHGTLYLGVTQDLIRRIHEHKNKLTGGFTARYGVDRLV